MTSFAKNLEDMVTLEVASALNAGSESDLTHRLADGMDSLVRAIVIMAITMAAGDEDFCDEVLETVAESLHADASLMLRAANGLKNTSWEHDA